MTRSRQPWLAPVLGATDQVRRETLAILDRGSASSLWHQLFSRFTWQCGVDNAEQFADAVAQAIACALLAARIGGDQWADQSVRSWISAGADPLVRQVLIESSWTNDAPGRTLRASAESQQAMSLINGDRGLTQATGSTGGSAELLYFFEAFLQAYDKKTKRRHGVFYTPRSVVNFVITNAHQILQREFHLPDGLIDTTNWSQITNQFGLRKPPNAVELDAPFVRVLDPAMGTGAFLLEIFRIAHAAFTPSYRDQNRRPSELPAAWTEFVNLQLLPRLFGIELMLAPVVLAHLLLARQLKQTGYLFDQPQPSQLFLSDTLRKPAPLCGRTANGTAPFTVVVGNPPYSSISHNSPDWMDRLLHGLEPDGLAAASYFDLESGPLRERKHWLHDDYVKFLRLAHWQIERAGAGLVGLVTNHGFLDNATFRAMRYHLLETFPRVSVIDLHGNKRKGEQAPDGGKDEGVFPIGQGVAVTLLRRPPEPVTTRRTEYAEVWGSRAKKLAVLDSTSIEDLQSCAVSPGPPYYLLVPKNDLAHEQYDRALSLPDTMPINCTAAVTARDAFVIAFTRDELIDRLREFCNPKIPDTSIRRDYFRNTRSSRYAAGDTRGWSLADARRRLASTPNWDHAIRSFQYRPFDHRWICWLPWMIDWPRIEVMRQMELAGNQAIIARRQAPVAQSYDFFWASDTLVVDGLIRSDNRGSESVFPLYIRGQSPTPTSLKDKCASAATLPSANFANTFVAHCGSALGLTWLPHGRGDLARTFGPEDLFDYLVALFHSREYRTRYRERLQLEFPRVIAPPNLRLWHTLCQYGRQLTDAILMRDVDRVPPLRDTRNGQRVEPGFPRYDGASIWINSQYRLTDVPERVWRFRVGTYQVCAKWWKDRRGRTVSNQERAYFRHVLQKIAVIQSVQDQIDATPIGD